MEAFTKLKKHFTSKLHSNPGISSLTQEEYESYKEELIENCARASLMGQESPHFYFDDKRRQIVLLNFMGLVENFTKVIIPYGVTTIYVTDSPVAEGGNSLKVGIDSDGDYSLSFELADTVEYIDYLPRMNIQELKTNKTKGIRLLNSNNRKSEQVIETLFIEDSLKLSECSGLLHVNKLEVMRDKSYTLKDVVRFIDRNHLKEIFVDANCSSLKCKDLSNIKVERIG